MGSIQRVVAVLFVYGPPSTRRSALSLWWETAYYSPFVDLVFLFLLDVCLDAELDENAVELHLEDDEADEDDEPDEDG